jgi:tetratricopeptide (TPR) repeat protein
VVVSSAPESRAVVTPEVEKECSRILAGWQAGKIVYQEAVERLAGIRQTATAENKPADEGYTEIINGIMQGYRGNLDASVHHFEQARDLMLKVGNREQVIRCLLNIGETYRLKGSFTRAMQHFKTAYEAAKEVGNRPIQLVARSNEGQMLISMKRYESARTILLECYRVGKEFIHSADAQKHEYGWKDHLCSNMQFLTEIYLELGEIEEAWRYASEALELANELKLPMELGRSNRLIGEVLTEKGLPDVSDDEIDAYFNKAVAAFREIKLDGDLGTTIYAFGKSLAKRGKKAAAARKLQQAVLIFTKLGMVDHAAKAAEAQINAL